MRLKKRAMLGACGVLCEVLFACGDSGLEPVAAPLEARLLGSWESGDVGPPIKLFWHFYRDGGAAWQMYVGVNAPTEKEYRWECLSEEIVYLFDLSEDPEAPIYGHIVYRVEFIEGDLQQYVLLENLGTGRTGVWRKADFDLVRAPD